MEQMIAKLLSDFEQGKMSRRQLIQSLALAGASAAALAPTAAAAEGRILKATNINHVSYQVADYARTRDFLAGLFGMPVSEDDGKQCRLTCGTNVVMVRTRPTGTPHVDHIAFTIEGWDQEKEAMAEELKRRGIKVVLGDTKTSLHILDPDGFEIQFGGLRQ
jgi:catechol 2,3-dioxygenase-like lactoylglutathione lyase family enzyme